MIRKAIVVFAFGAAAILAAPEQASAQSCGGAGQVPCYYWDWCAYTSTPSPLVLVSEGDHVTATVSVNDRAGNSAMLTTSPIRIDKTPPAMTLLSRLPAANASGWNNTDITATWRCVDGLAGAVAGTVSSTLTTEGAGLTLTGECADMADNRSLDVVGGLNLDKTPPVLTCSAWPASLWPPNNRMAPVDVALSLQDVLSGSGVFTLTDARSNEAGSGDIAGFAVGTPSLRGTLRATRAGSGSGRIYTLTYRGLDRAGNAASCTTTVLVPHDQGKSKQADSSRDA